MNILIVSWYFPPSNTIAAIRIGSLAKFLMRQNHEVRVITAKDPPYSQTLSIEFSAHQITRTYWIDINTVATVTSVKIKNVVSFWSRLWRQGHRGEDQPQHKSSGTQPDWKPSRLSLLYTNLLNFPDKKIGWLPFAVIEGRKLLNNWKPDIIYASGPPFTTLVVAHMLSIRFRLPLIVEFRDRWSNDPYYPPPNWRLKLEESLEKRIIRHSAGVITVSEPWARMYEQKYGKPTTVIYNGFDREENAASPCRERSSEDQLRVVYTGGIYPGRRDPSPLFEAIESLTTDLKNVCVEFYGTDESHVFPLAERYGIAHLVKVYTGVPNAEAVRLQREADVLLLMQWNNSKEQGNIPGKFFEYLGAKRPILLLGPEDGVPATIIRQRSAGCVANDPRSIARRLETWIKTKRTYGRIPDLPEQVRQGFSRAEQFAKVEPFLARIIGARSI